MIRFTVKMGATYHNRDGSVRCELRSQKGFLQPFVPQIGSVIYVQDDSEEFSASVVEVWWDTVAGTLTVHTETQGYSDGNVDKRRSEHIAFLEREGWSCSTR